MNTAAVIIPIAALANLLWLRILRSEGLHMSLRRYTTITVPVALPAFAAAAVTFGLERLLLG